jgi:hypothetical protein
VSQILLEATTHTYSFTASDVGADTFSVSSVSGGTFGTVSDFTINSATGAGTFKVTFGKGASTVIRLRLQDDDSGQSNELTLTATIQLLNNAPTNITLSPASVSENLAVGTVVGDFSTTDPDGDTSFTYALVSGLVRLTMLCFPSVAVSCGLRLCSTMSSRAVDRFECGQRMRAG